MKTCPFCAEEIQDAAIVCKHCGKEIARPGFFSLKMGLVGKVGLAIIGAFIALALVGSMMNGRGPVPSLSSGVTAAQFQQLRDGMSYADAVTILGSPGVETSRSHLADVETVMYTWQGSGTIGANMNAMFQNNRLISKAQFGLQ